jgi:hypothetical protein
MKIAGLPLVVTKLMSREKHRQFLGCESSRSDSAAIEMRPVILSPQ